MPNGNKSGKAQPLPKWLTSKQRKQVEGAAGERRGALIAAYAAQRKQAQSGNQQGGANTGGGRKRRPAAGPSAGKMPLLSVIPFSGVNDGLPSHVGDHTFPSTLHTLTGGSITPNDAFVMYVIPGWECRRAWARVSIPKSALGNTEDPVAWTPGPEYGLYTGFGFNTFSQPTSTQGVQQRTVSSACRVHATSSTVNTSGQVFMASGWFDYTAGWSPSSLANYVDQLKQANHLRPKSMVSTIARPAQGVAGPKSAVESRMYRAVTDLPTYFARLTEEDQVDNVPDVFQVERGHEDIIIVISDASSTVNWSFETERKVELIGNSGVLLHAKSRRPAHSPTVAAAADNTKQQLAMTSGA